MNKYKIILWGIGRRTERYMDFNYFANCEIVAFVDTNQYGKEYYGYKVLSPEDLKYYIDEVDYLVIATQFFCEVYEQCIDMEINKNKIIFTDYLAEGFMKQDLRKIKELSEKLYEDVRMRIYRFIVVNEKDDYDKDRLTGNGKFGSIEYVRDYFRYRTFEFVADEIINQEVEGDIAELGVFRGTFSALLNEKFKDRQLYLFDTFEGFEENEAQSEREKGRSNDEFEYSHRKTSEAILLENLPRKELCHICKGFFPKSVTDDIQQLRFAFVSIDVDFEDSIYEGIKFFYPRLSDGGVIYLHDYNSQFLTGVKVAVKRYEKDFNVKFKKIPLADRAGTLVIIK